MLKLLDVIKYGLLVSFAALLFAACEDQLGEDTLPAIDEDLIESQGQYFVQPGSPLLIDIFSSNVKFGTEFTVTIDQTTQLGLLEMMESGLLKYTPDVDAGTDYFVYTASSTQSNETDTDTITIDIGDPDIDSLCFPQANYDCFFFNFDEEVAWRYLDVLANDELCDGEIIEFDVFTDPLFGQVEVHDEDTALYLTYQAGLNFDGFDEFIYKVVLQFDQDDDSVALRNADEPVAIYGIVNVFHFANDTTMDSCAVAVDDFVELPPPAGDSANVESIIIDVLQNDWTCGFEEPTLEIVVMPEYGQATVRNEADQNMIEYFPVDQNAGVAVDYFEYQICESGWCDTGKVIIDYYGNCTTVANDDFLWFNMTDTANTDTTTFYIDVVENDRLCSNMEYEVTIIDEPDHGSYTLSNTVFVYEPDPAYWQNTNPSTASDQATYSLCDSENNCVNALIIMGCE